MKDIRIACMSDIHLGHKNNDAGQIIKKLDHAIFGDKLLNRIDLLIFAGDVFDRLLYLDYPHLAEIDAWFAKLIRACERHGVIFRVLEGTPRHDRGQSERIKTLHEIMHSQCDFQYVDKLSIESFPQWDCTVLYIPDEWRSDNEITRQEVQELMSSRNLEKVDIAVMHGLFQYQMPVQMAPRDAHDQRWYQNAVRSVIFIGHNHTHSRYGKIVSQGSFERLNHGEEEPKGYVYAEIRHGKAHIHFIENKAARHYHTVELYGLDIQQCFLKVEKALKGRPGDTCIRLKAEPGHVIFSQMDQLALNWPGITFDKLSKDEKTGESIYIPHENKFTEYQKLVITKDNLEAIMMERLNSHSDLGVDDHLFIREQIKECL